MFSCEVSDTYEIEKCEANQIINQRRFYVDRIDTVAWVIQRSNFVHKRKEIGGARSKHGERSVQVLVVKPEGKSYLEDLSINGRIILKWVLKKWDEDHGLNQCGSGERQLVGSCEFGNKSSRYIKWKEFLD